MQLFKMEFTVTEEEAVEIGRRLLDAQSPDEIDLGDTASLVGRAITTALASFAGPDHGTYFTRYHSEATTEYLQQQSRE
ncbi:hypothetical protein [Sphingomonas aerophila]|uniref:Uncharacterized protein n=1 Tax=Sphingomonas aerophila TaxID=1344948 RepID=A0A7W9BCM8_9SPHN|nr:hypothetical protein [Sphingomonas aerophila]MBB5714789.1 hypothetical protein [Sphingomonas aerophila]